MGELEVYNILDWWFLKHLCILWWLWSLFDFEAPTCFCMFSVVWFLYVALSHCFLLSLLCVSLNDSVNRVEIVVANCVVLFIPFDCNRCEYLMPCFFSCPFLRRGLVFFSEKKVFQPVSSGFSSSVLLKAAEICITVKSQHYYLV